jgi:hypothetical protein
MNHEVRAKLEDTRAMERAAEAFDTDDAVQRTLSTHGKSVREQLAVEDVSLSLDGDDSTWCERSPTREMTRRPPTSSPSATMAHARSSFTFFRKPTRRSLSRRPSLASGGSKQIP